MDFCGHLWIQRCRCYGSHLRRISFLFIKIGCSDNVGVFSILFLLLACDSFIDSNSLGKRKVTLTCSKFQNGNNRKAKIASILFTIEKTDNSKIKMLSKTVSLFDRFITTLISCARVTVGNAAAMDLSRSVSNFVSFLIWRINLTHFCLPKGFIYSVFLVNALSRYLWLVDGCWSHQCPCDTPPSQSQCHWLSI